MPAPGLPPDKLARIAECAAAGMTRNAAAKHAGLDYRTVCKYWPADTGRAATPDRVPGPNTGTHPASFNDIARPFLPDPAPEAGGPSLPDPIPLTYDPVVIDTPGRWLVLCDIHLPYHDKRTIEAAVAEGQRAGAVGVLLNGDVLDCYQLSTHYKEPDRGRFKDEIGCGRAFFAWLRSRFPRARVVYKEGNHDDRLRRYLAERAPEVFDLPDLTLPALLGLDEYGVEWVGDKRVIRMGKLHVVHGHEFRGGGGVNPARWLFLRTVTTAMCGHFHRTSEHHEQGLDRTLHGVWSVGCACYLYPQYDPNNRWNHGYAMVELHGGSNGDFTVTNRRLLPDGRVR